MTINNQAYKSISSDNDNSYCQRVKNLLAPEKEHSDNKLHGNFAIIICKMT